MAFPTGWKHRLAVKIKKNEVDADLSAFTFVLHDSFDDVFTQINGPLDADGSRPSLDGGGDVRFTSDKAGANRLSIDPRTWETDNDPGEGKLEVAVKVPEVSEEEDTTIYMWWGKEGESQPDADADYGQHDAYDASYKGVYPLDDGDDRTSNQNHMTPINSPTLGADGAIGGCFENDGSNRYLVRLEDIVSPGSMTISSLAYTTDTESNKEIAALGDSNAGGRTWRCNMGRATAPNEAAAIKQAGTNSRFSGGSDYQAEEWNHIAVRLANTVCQSVLNGVADTNNSSALAPSGMNRTTIGAVIYNGTLFAPMVGKIDEVRFSDVLRSEAWITAEHSNLLAPGDFFEFGTIEDLEEEIIATTVGAVELRGQAANISAATTIEVTAAESEVAGQSVGISAGTTVQATVGTIEIAGPQASIELLDAIAVKTGEIQVRGFAAAISAATTIHAGTGRINVAGRPAIIVTDVFQAAWAEYVNIYTGA